MLAYLSSFFFSPLYFTLVSTAFNLLVLIFLPPFLSTALLFVQNLLYLSKSQPHFWSEYSAFLEGLLCSLCICCSLCTLHLESAY